MNIFDPGITMTNPSTKGEDSRVQAVLRTLDAQAEQFDVATQMRLNEARARAIAATRLKAPFWHSRSFFAAAFACSAAVALVVLMQPSTLSSSSEIEATALFEATFGAELADELAANPAEFFAADLDAPALAATALDEAGLDATVVANDLEFYTWLSETTRAERAPTGSDS